MTLPLVSILIPTFNRPLYFEQALVSALNQTYSTIEIVVSDDSTNNDTEVLIQKYLATHPNIIYCHNPKPLGGVNNFHQVFNLANGEYINYLMDDDLFQSQKLEKMVSMFDESISLVTSHRQIIDQNGNFIPDIPDTQRISTQDSLFSGAEMAKSSILRAMNFIGEPTTVLFRKKDLVEPFGYFYSRQFKNNVDLASWYSLLSRGNAIYLVDSLSFFRIHPDSVSHSVHAQIQGLADVIYAFIAGPQVFQNIDPHHQEYIGPALNVVHRAVITLNQFIGTSDPELIGDLVDLTNLSIELCGALANMVDVANLSVALSSALAKIANSPGT